MIALEVIYFFFAVSYFDLVRLLFLITVRSFGIIGGGAVLFAATSLAGQAILPAIGRSFSQENSTHILQALEEQLQQQEEPEPLALLPSALHALASAVCYSRDEEEDSDVHNPASRSSRSRTI